MGDARFAKRAEHPGDASVDDAVKCPRPVRTRDHVLGVRQRSIRKHGVGVLQNADVRASVVLPAEIELRGSEVGGAEDKIAAWRLVVLNGIVSMLYFIIGGNGVEDENGSEVRCPFVPWFLSKV